MDLQQAKELPEGIGVFHANRGPGVWLGVDEWDKESCHVEFDDGEAQVSLNLVEVR